MRKVFALGLAAALLVGCTRRPDPAETLPGTWVTSEPVAIAFAFAKGGRFEAQPVGQDDIDEGTYTIEGDRLTLHHGPSIRKQIDQAFRMTWEGSDSIKLTYLPEESTTKDPEVVTFNLRRQGSGQRLDRRAVAETSNSQRLAQTGTERCLSNLKQISLAMAMYAADYDEVSVRETWAEDLKPYMKNASALSCPAAAAGGYALNEELAGRSLSSIADPAKEPAVFDSDAGNPIAPPTSLPRPNRHLEGNNVAYADGHAATLP